jgi:hypothetical protein
MKHIRTYLKNSEGEYLMKCEVEDSPIKFPVRYYDINGKPYGEDLELKGFVEIKEKKFLIEKRKSFKN